MRFIQRKLGTNNKLCLRFRTMKHFSSNCIHFVIGSQKCVCMNFVTQFVIKYEINEKQDHSLIPTFSFMIDHCIALCKNVIVLWFVRVFRIQNILATMYSCPGLQIRCAWCMNCELQYANFHFVELNSTSLIRHAHFHFVRYNAEHNVSFMPLIVYACRCVGAGRFPVEAQQQSINFVCRFSTC